LRQRSTRTAAVINEMLRGFTGFHSRLLELAILHQKSCSYTPTTLIHYISSLDYKSSMLWFYTIWYRSSCF